MRTVKENMNAAVEEMVGKFAEARKTSKLMLAKQKKSILIRLMIALT